MAKSKIKKNPLHSLFPYQIKNRENFYFRDHPYIHPEAPSFKKYWMEQLKKIIEGVWVNDEGTWVYMTPKLYFYINITEIVDEDRNPISPRLRDNEWILFSYFMYCEGFSGFEKDEKYTCDFRVGQLQEKIKAKKKLTKTQIANIPDTAKTPDGEYKEWIHPWKYLTETYLIDEPAKEPLGHPIYSQYNNGVILSARTIGKSLCVFVGDMLHEFLTGGVKRMENIGKINKRLLFGAGCRDSRQLDRSLANVNAIYNNMPGKYRFGTVGGKEMPDYMGPFYKKVQGNWESGNSVEHKVKNKNNTTDILGSLLQFTALTKDKKKVGAGDRFRRIIVEEFGFQDDIIDVIKTNRDSLRVNKKPVGYFIGLGTSGDMKTIKQPKKVFENPAGYGVAGIPNFWENPNKMIGLFISTLYASEDFKDKNGNTNLQEAYEAEMNERQYLLEHSDSASVDAHIMFNPIIPSEMTRSNAKSILPKQEALDQRNDLFTYDVFKSRAMIGRLKDDIGAPRGVSFEKDIGKNLRPILEWKDEDDFEDKTGAFIMYEQPLVEPPPGLYWVIYDPAKQSGDGESFHSVIVYKYMYTGSSQTMYDTIVATWIGRLENLDDNFRMVIRIAKFFNAKIFPEINVAGFVEWCSRTNNWGLLEEDAQFLEKEISPGSKRSWYKVGFRMANQRTILWCLRRAHNWLMTPKEVDPITGIARTKTINWILDPRTLDEIANHNGDDNFDMISCLLGLQLLIGKLDGENIPNVDEEDRTSDELTDHMEFMMRQIEQSQRESLPKFLQY